MKKDNIQILNDDIDVDFKALIKVLWAGRKLIIILTIVITFLGVIYAFLATPLYNSKLTMYPTNNESGGSFNQLKGVASSWGLNIGGMEGSFNIPELVKSRRIKTELIYGSWESEKFENPVNLIQYWEINKKKRINVNPLKLIRSILNWFFINPSAKDKNNSLILEEIALNLIDGRLSVSEDKMSGMITVNLLMEEPALASEIVNTIYTEIVEFNVRTHSQQVKLNRQFIEKRQDEARIELKAAEEYLKEFRQRNRNVSESPELQLQLERLLREVEIQTQVYITLQQQYEIARIEEVKETPSVIILDEGKPAVKRDSPNRKKMVIIAFLLGITIGSSYILVRRLLV